jgi:putative endonuclease
MIGTAGEVLAKSYLQQQGFSICGVNVRPKIKGERVKGELDIVAFEGDTLCFIEVKTRLNLNSAPEESVDKRKRRKIISLAEAYIIENEISYDVDCRFDVVSVILDEYESIAKSITLIRNAYCPE